MNNVNWESTLLHRWAEQSNQCWLRINLAVKTSWIKHPCSHMTNQSSVIDWLVDWDVCLLYFIIRASDSIFDFCCLFENVHVTNVNYITLHPVDFNSRLQHWLMSKFIQPLNWMKSIEINQVTGRPTGQKSFRYFRWCAHTCFWLSFIALFFTYRLPEERIFLQHANLSIICLQTISSLLLTWIND